MASEDQVLNGWMAAIARDGWREAGPGSVAELSGVPLSDIVAVLPDRWSALTAFGRRLDRAALAEAASDPDASVRDRLFALLMARFDAGDDHKATVRSLGEAAKHDPALGVFLLGSQTVSIARIASAAGVETGGLLGPLRVEALTVMVLHATQTWLDDADPDLAATMKALDTDLERAERWANWRPGKRSDDISDAVAP